MRVALLLCLALVAGIEFIVYGPPRRKLLGMGEPRIQETDLRKALHWVRIIGR